MFKKISWLHWIVLLTSVFLNHLTNLTPVPPFILLLAISDHSSCYVDIVFKNQTLCPPRRILHPCIAISITKSLSLPLLFLEFLGNFSIFGTQLPRSSFFLVDLILSLKKILAILLHQTLCIPLGFVFPWLHSWSGSPPLFITMFSPAFHSVCPLSHLRESAFTPSFKPPCIFRIVSQII